LLLHGSSAVDVASGGTGETTGRQPNVIQRSTGSRNCAFPVSPAGRADAARCGGQERTMGQYLGWIILSAIVLFAIYGVTVYNGLVTLRQRCRQAFSDIDVQLKQRHDLVPNLVETVKGYASHERETLDAV